MRQTKLAIVTHRFYPNVGGVEKHVYEISRRLVRLGFEVDVITADKNGLPKFESFDGIRIFRFRSLHPSNAYYFSPQIYTFLRKRDYDIVHAHNYHAFPSLFASKPANKLVFTPHYHGKGSSFLRNILNKPYKLIAKSIFSKADAVICVSEFEKGLLLKNFSINKKKVVVIPNGVDIDFIKKVKPTDDSNFILYIGRIENYKNIDLLIKAMKYLPEIKLYIGGEGKTGHLKKLSENLGVSERVKFLGRVSEEEKFALMKSCSVFVNLSSIEAFGINVIEAIACSTPCVVNANTGLMEIAKRFECVKAASLDVKHIVNAIKEALNTKVSSTEVKTVEKEFSWDSVVDKLKSVYWSVIK